MVSCKFRGMLVRRIARASLTSWSHRPGLISHLWILIYHRMSLEAKLQQASVEYQKLQADLSKAVEARQRLDAQLSENELVKKVPLVRSNGENYSDTTFPGIWSTYARKCGIQAHWPSFSKTRSSWSKEQRWYTLGLHTQWNVGFFIKNSLHKKKI